jgi:hypothetical protein
MTISYTESTDAFKNEILCHGGVIWHKPRRVPRRLEPQVAMLPVILKILILQEQKVTKVKILDPDAIRPVSRKSIRRSAISVLCVG